MTRPKTKADPELAWREDAMLAAERLYLTALALYEETHGSFTDYERCLAEKAKRAA